jgi:hypothetical protein
MLFDPVVEELRRHTSVRVMARLGTPDERLGSTLGLLWTLLRTSRRLTGIYVTTAPPSIFLAVVLLKCFWRLRVVLHIHDLYPDILALAGSSWLTLAMRLLKVPFGMGLRRVEGMIVPSEGMRRAIMERYGVPNSRIQVIENWTDIPVRMNRETTFSGRMLYLGNIGIAHDTGYFQEYARSTQGRQFEYLFKVSEHSKQSKFGAERTEGFLEFLAEEGISVDDRRLPVEELQDLVDKHDYAMVFIGEGFDKVLFPCKIYGALARLVPIVVFGPRESWLAQWVTEHGVGCHYLDLPSHSREYDRMIQNIVVFNSEISSRGKAQKVARYVQSVVTGGE